MVISLPVNLPESHRDFLDRAVGKLQQEAWLIGVAATGSFATDTMDAFSDLDLVLVVEGQEHAAVMRDRRSIALSLSPLLSCFTGEHVGEPRLLICLYGPPLLHVDLMFVPLPDAANQGDDLIVLWERDPRLSLILSSRTISSLELDAQWIEDRFWVWVHKACGKIGRGEIYAVIEYLVFLRSKVLGPLGLHAVGQRPIGVRRIESDAPPLAVDLESTVATHNATECLAALRASVKLYRQLRANEGQALQYRHQAERAVIDYLDEIENLIRMDPMLT